MLAILYLLGLDNTVTQCCFPKHTAENTLDLLVLVVIQSSGTIAAVVSCSMLSTASVLWNSVNNSNIFYKAPLAIYWVDSQPTI